MLVNAFAMHRKFFKLIASETNSSDRVPYSKVEKGAGGEKTMNGLAIKLNRSQKSLGFFDGTIPSISYNIMSDSEVSTVSFSLG